ncbi:MAG: DUF1015 domain-containing protein [Polyangia bacterium]|jgi:uncharacterized protein (DUF1015 family)|nr:DUF1015 domain-containing protein [Polyangia bacterium]
MSLIRPFRGLRPAPGFAKQVAAPPYDVLSSAEARVMAKGNPASFLHVNKPEIDLPEDVSLYDDRVYGQAVTNLRRFIAEGTLVQDPQPWLYLYRQTMGKHQQYGLMACVSAEEYERDLIKRHELTRQDKEDDRTRHVADTDCNAGPVFLTYRAQPEIDALASGIAARTPDEDFVADDGIGHTLWIIKDAKSIEALVALFAAIPATCVADGHHRSASAARVARMRREKNPSHRGDEEYNFFLAVLFPHDQLQILDYNRLVKDLHGLTEEAFLAQVKEKFDVSPTDSPKPAAVREFGMYLGGKWYRLKAPSFTTDGLTRPRAFGTSL